MPAGGMSLYGIEIFPRRERRKLDLGPGARGFYIVRNPALNRATRAVVPYVKLTLVVVFIVIKVV